RRGVRWVQAAGEDPGPGRTDLPVERGQPLPDRLHDLRAGRGAVGLLDAEQIAGHAATSYVAMMTPVVETTLSTSVNVSGSPSGKSRRPWPSTRGWIKRTYRLIMCSARSDWISCWLPITVNGRSSDFSWVSSRTRTEFGQSS